MKTGILTFHDADNYGAVLQAYALAQWLQQHGIDPEIVNYRSKIFDKYKVFRTERYKRAPYIFGVDLLKCLGKRKRSRNFASFRRSFLPVSAESYPTRASLDDVTGKYDAFLCGSDQVWNPELNRGIDPVYFLDFVSDSRKKIAYAPSVALNRLTEFQKAQMVRYMSSFSALSIREQEAIDLLQPYCDKNITKACDPVFLPDRSCYDRICSQKYQDGKFVFLYVVGPAAKFKKVISYAEKKAREKGMKLYYLIDGDKTFCHIGGKNVFGCKPSDFLSLIRNASYVISNSFHATAFSILFEKQFVTFLKEGTGSRMVNLLRDFGMTDRVFQDNSADDILAKEISYQDFAATLESFRRESESYLLGALGLLPENARQSDGSVTDRSAARKELFDFVAWRRSCFLVRHKEKTVVSGSRSGGAFTALSDAVLDSGGVVYGCMMDGVDTAVHRRAATKQERDLFRGSKYIQSRMGECYKQVREDLRNGVKVLFSGTGCQVAGLYGYLRGEDLTNLYTVDIVCHGVPSASLWRAYLDWMEEKHGAAINAVNFRDKRYGWKAHLETVQTQKKRYATSTFRVLFLKNAFLRPSCYECPFSTLRRKSDLTIGDAWGIESTSSAFNDNKGCSLVMPNSEKGMSLFRESESALSVEQADLEQFMQPNLYEPSKRPAKREKYWQCLWDEGFRTLKKRYGRPGLFRRIKDLKLILRRS